MTKEQVITKDVRDFLIWMKYAQFRPDLERRESFNEIINRVKKMYIKKVPQLSKQLTTAFEYVMEGKLLPSMRAMHFAGEGIEKNNARIYNCAAVNIESPKDFADTMFLLLSGCGVGAGLEHTKITRLPYETGQIVKFPIPDSIEGWAESFQLQIEAWIRGEKIEFDYSDIRPKGAEIKSIHATAPGPDGLRKAHEEIANVLRFAREITAFEALRILCFMSSAVMSGGIRRAALIGILKEGDPVLEIKQTDDWKTNYPELALVNISIAHRDAIAPPKTEYTSTLKNALNYGEPGYLFFDGENWLVNPCAEIILSPYQFCNLVEINGPMLTRENWKEVMIAAALLGFIQSRFTDFHFLSPEWKKVTEKERLVGVSITGIAGMSEDIPLRECSNLVKETLDKLNMSYGEGTDVPRWTTVKPAGHTSLLFNTSSGIHSYPAHFYLRRITLAKDSALGRYLHKAMNPIFLEQDMFDKTNYKLTIPMKAPEGAICQTDKGEALQMLKRIKHVYTHWIDNQNPSNVANNISATVSIPKGEEDIVLSEMYKMMGVYSHGMTVLYQDNSYEQPIWQPITEELYNEYVKKWPMFLNTTLIMETKNNTNLGGELACSSGGCEVT